MATAIHASRHVTPRPPWMRPQPPRHDTLLGTVMVVIALLSVASLALSAPVVTVTVPRSLVGVTRRSIEARPRDGSAPVATVVPAVGTEEAAPEPPESASEAIPMERDLSAPGLTVGGRARVAKTQGAGVILHAAPRTGARRPAGLLEGTTVSVLELASGAWARVQSDGNQSGWVPTTFLVAAD